MARTAITPQQVTRSGLTPSYASAHVDGNMFPNGGQEILHVKTVGTGCTVTVQIPGTVDGQAIADRTIVIGTNAERFIGPFPPTIYNQSDGQLYVDYSAVTAVTVAALLPNS